MASLAAFALGAAFALAGVWLGFYLARVAPDAPPTMPSLPENYEGAILDEALTANMAADDQ